MIMRIRQIVENVTQDMSYALRGFRRSPGFTVSVIVMLALGIGANTAIFSFVDRLLIRQLPYPQSNQLVVLYETFPSTLRSNVSPANWLDWQRLNRSFETLAAWNGTSATLTSDGDPELIFGQTVSSEFFPALRVQPHLGRLFTPEDDGPDAPSVVILSLNLWKRRFGGDSNIVGKKIELDSVAREVIGVLPQGFYFLNPATEYWTPYSLDRNRDWRTSAARTIPSILGRMKPGVPLPAAQAEMRTIAKDLEQLYPANKNNSVNIVALRDVLTDEVRWSLIVLLRNFPSFEEGALRRSN